MPALTDTIHLFLTIPIYLIIALVVLAVRGFREGADTRWRWRRYVFPFAALLVYAFSVPVVSNALVQIVERQFTGPEQLPDSHGNSSRVILVLTSGWVRPTRTGYDVKIGQTGWERTLAAVALWRQIGGTLLFSGLPTPDGADSAAAAMARVAGQLGVPAAAIRVEPASLNTYQNLLNSRAMLPGSGGEVWLVTSALHMPRAMAAARRLGLAPIAYPCDFRAEERGGWDQWLPSNDGASEFEEAMHELLGLVWYRLRGWG